ncbi:uncharacterized protein A1O9_04176 [Exophiala aquamarina CBS 119918]|uniref:Arylsulfotransferase N-terminal domain-containing protein n=1 Tax=Exophiala aquamarina CBS 119918 TaxID=1182545 RepID=A0A072PHX6_9EURO|nr:uncharacterized protein A1O9_04176 [Exophiala aquamarina CBS 119918]KEF59332.1 hypothetical protein A1O9_04176 [Exophiala aquamarina CBS 119918]
MAPTYLLSFLFGLAATSAIQRRQDATHLGAPLCAANSRKIMSNSSDPNLWPWQEYQSSDAQPPQLLTNSTGEPLFDGFLVMATMSSTRPPAVRQQSPLIMSDTGELVWSGPIQLTSDFRVQSFDGSPVLTYFTGEGTTGAEGVVGHGYGGFTLLDTRYNEIARVCPIFDGFTMEPGVSAICHADPHESFITHRNTMLLTAYNATQADLTSLGGPHDGWVSDSLVAEVNINTGEVLFTWSPLAHVPLNRTHLPLGNFGQNQSTPFDFFHVNSIQLVGENYLINARNYWSTYLVSPEGEIIWEINGGDGGDFGALPEGGSFAWEHDAQVREIDSSHAVFSCFANNNFLPTRPDSQPSFAVALSLSLPPDPLSPPVLLSNMSNPGHRLDAWSQGAFSQLPNGNNLVAYGSEPVVMEYGPLDSTNPEGHVHWTGTFGYPGLVSSYRVFKQQWHATPATQPSLVVLRASSEVDLPCAINSTHIGYVSWNGATDVTDWVVYAGATENSLEMVGHAKKAGFETQFAVPSDAAFIQVGAVEKKGKEVIRRSEVVAV